MSSMEDRLNKLREERIAREKARIEKLRELNLKKYNGPVKNNLHVNGTTKRPTSAPAPKKTIKDVAANKTVQKSNSAPQNFISNNISKVKKDKLPAAKVETKITNSKVTNGKLDKNVNEKTAKPLKEINKDSVDNNNKNNNEVPKIVVTDKTKDVANKNVNNKVSFKNDFKSRKSIAVMSKTDNKPKFVDRRKSMLPNIQKANPPNANRESVFDRLYKPKAVPKQSIDNVLKLRTDPNYLKQVINNSRLLMNKRHTMFESKPIMPVRRSISAVHFKRISKSELSNCVHKWASIGEKIDKVHLKDVNEDDSVKDEKVVSAVKSERKKVKFQTPVPSNFNTPRPEELQSRLQKWLQKRGKAIDEYHHLQCFGLHHLTREIRPFNIDAQKVDLYDDENKENIAVDNDSDNESFLENMNNKNGDLDAGNKDGFPVNKWRRASSISDSVDFNDSYSTTLTSGEPMHHVDELLLGALSDLNELLKEGFDWEQCARWLRAIRDRFPSAPDHAQYWECRAALEERRGDLPASVQCWEQAIAKGTEHAVVDANLDQLLNKFMQLKISPNSGGRQADPKLLEVKNVFKSTIIRFAVQQAKLRQSTGTPKYTVTPVRRSSRLSTHWRTQTPLRVCTTIHQANELGPTEFKPNKALTTSP